MRNLLRADRQCSENPIHRVESFLKICTYTPQVLSVGATQLNDNDTVYDAESAMNVPSLFDLYESLGLSYPPDVTFSSAGGFSNYFARPDYQAHAVNTYFKR